MFAPRPKLSHRSWMAADAYASPFQRSAGIRESRSDFELFDRLAGKLRLRIDDIRFSFLPPIRLRLDRRLLEDH